MKKKVKLETLKVSSFVMEAKAEVKNVKGGATNAFNYCTYLPNACENVH